MWHLILPFNSAKSYQIVFLTLSSVQLIAKFSRSFSASCRYKEINLTFNLIPLNDFIWKSFIYITKYRNGSRHCMINYLQKLALFTGKIFSVPICSSVHVPSSWFYIVNRILHKHTNNLFKITSGRFVFDYYTYFGLGFNVCDLWSRAWFPIGPNFSNKKVLLIARNNEVQRAR